MHFKYWYLLQTAKYFIVQITYKESVLSIIWIHKHKYLLNNTLVCNRYALYIMHTAVRRCHLMYKGSKTDDTEN